MKISIAWVFDHIDADASTVDVPALVTAFNRTIAEIEGFIEWHPDFANFSFASVVAVAGGQIVMQSPEWQTDCILPARDGVKVQEWYLIKKHGDQYTWATGPDLQSEKECVLPPFVVGDAEKSGAWKKSVEAKDYILDVDNKSLTHRPDMWGHRGFAREVAALLDLPLKPLDQFLATKKVRNCDTKAPVHATMPFSITIDNTDACSRFAGLYMPSITHAPSAWWMASRLLRVDARPIDAIVDATNYMMFDVGHPMHAFDAATLQGEQIHIRSAAKKEKLTVLDGDTLQLTPHDLLIADAHAPISLAGIKGGATTGISEKTKSVLLEAAGFDATTIRRTAVRFGKRTEASSRFEKSLDPNQNIMAIKRFLALLDKLGVAYKAEDTITSVGKQVRNKTITITHAFLQVRLGVELQQSFVEKILKQLNFEVSHADGMYTITVPTQRSTKDIAIPEDIVEEVGRFYGYDTITPVMPTVQLSPSNMTVVSRRRSIKRFCAYALQMHEVSNYALYEESFLQQLNWDPGSTLAVQSPVSQEWRRPVSSLIPHLIKGVAENSTTHDQVRLFELARVWQSTKKTVQENNSLAGVFFDKKKSVDFYVGKDQINRLFAMLGITVEWRKPSCQLSPWYHQHQTAELVCNDQVVGVAGVANSDFIEPVAHGHGFVFELNADFLLSTSIGVVQAQVLSKYPSVARDVSVLITREHTVADLMRLIKKQDAYITDVMPVDFFEKKEWVDKKAVTFRMIIRNPEKTMTGDEVDVIATRVTNAFIKLGGEIR